MIFLLFGVSCRDNSFFFWRDFIFFFYLPMFVGWLSPLDMPPLSWAGWKWNRFPRSTKATRPSDKLSAWWGRKGQPSWTIACPHPVRYLLPGPAEVGFQRLGLLAGGLVVSREFSWIFNVPSNFGWWSHWTFFWDILKSFWVSWDDGLKPPNSFSLMQMLISFAWHIWC